MVVHYAALEIDDVWDAPDVGRVEQLNLHLVEQVLELLRKVEDVVDAVLLLLALRVLYLRVL